MKYVCDICGWTYDEAEGLPDSGIAAGTDFRTAELPQEQSSKIFRRILSARSAVLARTSSARLTDQMGPLTGGSNTRMTSPEMAENGANTPFFIDKTRASGYK